MRNVSPLDESIKLPFANALFPLGLGTGSSHRRLFKVALRAHLWIKSQSSAR